MNLNTPIESAIRTKKEFILSLKEMELFTIRDLLEYYPRTYEDLSKYSKIKGTKDGEKITVRGFFHEIKIIPTRNRKMKLIKGSFIDEHGFECDAVWFNQTFLLRTLPLNKEVVISAKVQYKFGKYTLQSPVVEEVKSIQIHTGNVVPVYPQHENITSKWLREKIHPFLYLSDDFPEIIPKEIIKEEGLISKGEAVKEIHFPTTQKHLDKALDRLGYEELFVLQLNAVKNKMDWKESRTQDGNLQGMLLDPEFVKQFFSTLPFTPTNAQKICIYEILKDMEKPYPMMRLMEGDVGSGKTVVAMMALLQAVKYGYQTAIMAPTEVLARQHMISISKFIDEYELAFPNGKQTNIQLLVGSLKTKEKKAAQDGIKNGQVDIAVGTHALVQKSIEFGKLGLVVVDEQHRFGVKQREVLVKQGSPHVLNMTATPIPRTLALVAYGDQDLSVLNEMPPGRQAVITEIVAPERRKEIYDFVASNVDNGQQIYVICPLVDESDVLELKSVKKEYEVLHDVFPQFNIGLLHGKMKSEEKEAVMSRFKAGEIDILVSTSVIEVGIDVPNATVMLIEGADRFGLSQLHQFRGRVGRGKVQSYCYLFTESSSPSTYERLKAMAEYTDGFKLAEIDLKLRGPGEVYGIKQSGIPDLKIANVMNGVLLDRVRKAAEHLISKSPDLSDYPDLQSLLISLRKKMEE